MVGIDSMRRGVEMESLCRSPCSTSSEMPSAGWLVLRLLEALDGPLRLSPSRNHLTLVSRPVYLPAVRTVLTTGDPTCLSTSSAPYLKRGEKDLEEVYADKEPLIAVDSIGCWAVKSASKGSGSGSGSWACWEG